jgi:tRNA A-37 threonylcarbamoyl transferase component Bud32
MSLEGKHLGEFEIIERLGQGGMGAVYKARQISLGRTVAIKTLQSSLAGDANYIARFRQEAVAAAGLSHPNLVQVHAAGESDGLHWFAMEYIEGESAQARLKREGRLEPLEAIAITMHVATALDYGWRKAALIHRDIKPDNIFLSSDGGVKLGDLGLAKSAGQATGLTATGAIMGTPHYMSPEQLEAVKDTDLRSDIYSLGCTLYHLLSGKPPYVGNSSAAVMVKHLSDPVPDMSAIWREPPAELARAVGKMMQKQPADRQQSYGEVMADLRRASNELSGAIVPFVIAPPKKAVRGKAKSALYAGLAAVAIAAATAVILWAKTKAGPGPPAAAAAAGPPVAAGGAIAAREDVRMTPAATLAGDRTLAFATTPPPAKPVPAIPAPISEPSAPATPAPATPSPATPAPATPAPATPAPATPAPSTPALSTPALTAPEKPASEIAKWLARVDGPQQEAFQKQVLKPFEAGMADLRARYLAALDEDIAKASAAGELAEALLWRTERQAFEKAQNVAADDANTPAGVKVLRAAFRQQFARLDLDRATKAKALLAPYDAILAKTRPS